MFPSCGWLLKFWDPPPPYCRILGKTASHAQGNGPVVRRIQRIMKSELDFKWAAVLDLQVSFSAQDVAKKARNLFLLLHPDKSNLCFSDDEARICVRQALHEVQCARESAEDWLQQNPWREGEEQLFSQSSSWESCWKHSNLNSLPEPFAFSGRVKASLGIS